MADPSPKEQQCVRAFTSGNQNEAEQLLLHLSEPSMSKPADLTTTFQLVNKLGVKNGGVVAQSRVSLLHLAAYWGWENVVVELVSVYKCVANCKDLNENIPLHYAAYNGNLDVVKYLVDIDEHSRSCPSNLSYETPLHFACQNGHLNIAQYLINEMHYDPSSKGSADWTPLHYACSNGHLNIAQYLIGEKHCIPSCKNKYGTTPLHFACGNGHFNIAQYLIKKQNCNPSQNNTNCCTPLHFSCRFGQLGITKYLIADLKCNPSCENRLGETPLHEACTNNHAHIVQYLLSTGRVNPQAVDKNGHTALFYASENYDIVKLFQPFEECRTAFPVHTFTKLVLTGDSGAGKTTITELIIRLASSTEAVKCEHLTAGIIPHHIQSEQLGNFVVYDFAGQLEYYSSHSAMLELVMRRSAAIFLCVVDLSESKEKICESLHYWLSFIDNACSTTEGRSHVVIVGSHADQVSSEEEMKKSSLLQEIATKRVKRQQYNGFLSMNCCYADTDVSHRLIATLTDSQKAIAASQPVISYYSHVVYAFLRTKLNVVGCTVHHLVSVITKENDFSLPNDQSVLIKILTTLSDRGLILFVSHPYSSWVIVKTEALLKEINGTIFAPDHFKEHRDLASNTGVVPVSNLHKVFPNYNLEMLVGFLMSLNFCRPVDPSMLQYTNLQTTPSHSTADLLFFPSLVQSERPDNLVQQGALEFGWCLRCMDAHEFLSSRFLHVLLLSVAYKFPLSQVASSSVRQSGLQRICTVWKNGIFWRTLDNITTVIELLDNNRCVLVAMSCDDNSPVEHAELRSSLIALVRHLKHQYCPRLNVCEFIISRNLIQQYPLDNLPNSDLFDIHHVAQSMLHHKKGVPSYKDGHGYLIIEALPFEPYHQLSFSSVCQLFNPSMADQPVPGPLLQKVRQLCHLPKIKPQEFGELRKHLDRMSLFAGRNPLVSRVAVLYSM